jgi:hypothetical protein
MTISIRAWAAATVAAVALTPGLGWACACGCGVFGVGTSSLFASGSGGTVSLEYDLADQTRNWSGGSRAPAADNDDKQVRTGFFTARGQYMIDRRWGLVAEVPVWDRTVRMDEGMGVESIHNTALGDIRLMGVYTGLSADMSTGLILGAKLPTGDSSHPGLERDMQIGTGSTDLLVGAYHMGALTKDRRWIYFAQGMWETPLAYRGGYRVGGEVNAAAGVYYDSVSLAGGRVKVAPLLQLIASHRAADHGAEGDPDNSGYDRLMVSPGLEFDMGAFRLYGDVELPVYQHVRGQQLTAPAMFKLIVSRSF